MSLTPSSQPLRPLHRGRMLAAVLATLVVAGALAAVAVAAGGGTVRAGSSKELGARVAVNAQGHTLYALSPETRRHLLCTSRACLRAWHPLTVGSRNARLVRGRGVHGRLGAVRRGAHVFQVTLNGLPLYSFIGDKKPGQAHGQALKGFGGVWHAMLASGKVSPKVPRWLQPVTIPHITPPTYTPPPPIVPPGPG